MVAGKLLLEAAAAAHDRAARALRMCRQLRTKTDGNTSGGGGGLLARSLDRERQRTVRLLLLHRHRRHRHRNNNDDDVDAYGMGDGDTDDGERCCCCCRPGRRRLSETVNGVDGGVHRNGANGRRQHQPYHECWSDDDGGGGTDPVTVTNGTAVDHCSGAGSAEQVEQFAGIAGIPGLDADRGVLVRRECLIFRRAEKNRMFSPPKVENKVQLKTIQIKVELSCHVRPFLRCQIIVV